MANEVLWAEGRPIIPTQIPTSSPKWFEGRPVIIWVIGPGTNNLRIYFELRTTDAGFAAYARIYRRGEAIGTERSTNSETYVTFTEDIMFRQGDTLELWCKVAAGGTYYVRNLRILGTTPTATVNGLLGVNS